MAMLNIPSSVKDPSYRYKMPRILTQKECRGQGSKTGIMNVGDVAHHIKRDPVYLVKFFGYELGAQTTYTNKKSEGERAIVNGHHETPVIQMLVDRFIEKYVLCAACNLPEIDMVVKRGLLVAQCKACGWKGELDNRHKLAAYISKNPPGSGIGFGEGESKKTKEERQRQRAVKAQKKQGDEDSETASYRSEDDKEEQKENKTKKDKKEKREKKAVKPQTKGGDEDSEAASYQSDDGKKEQKGKKTKKEKKEKTEKKAKKAQKDKEGTGEGSEDEDAEAKDVKSKMDKSDACKKDGHQGARAGQGEERGKTHEKDSDPGSGEEKASDEDEDQELAFDGEIMVGVVKDIAHVVRRKADKLTVDGFFEEVRVQQVTKAFDHKLRMYAVVSALFPEGTLDAEDIKSRSKFIKAFISNGALPFADWVWGFEAYVAANPAAAKTWAMTLKILYDEDLAEEEEILGYYRNDHHSSPSPGFDLSRKAVVPLLEWLESTADDNEDSD